MQKVFPFLLAILLMLPALGLAGADSQSGSTSNSYEMGIRRDRHGKIVRSTKARSAFITKNPCPSTGKSHGACPGYVVDHIISLKRGGVDDPSNMQWQTTADAKAKDRWE